MSYSEAFSPEAFIESTSTPSPAGGAYSSMTGSYSCTIDTQTSAEFLKAIEQVYTVCDILEFEDYTSETKPKDDEPPETKAETATNPMDLLLRNWNKEFTALLDEPDSLPKFTRLAGLARDFVYVAEQYGRIIISELHIESDAQTVRPAGLGGVAGGRKYVIQGILFKFSLDSEVGGQYLYGRTTPNHEKALIHYRGYCLTAMSVLPLGKGSLHYGSGDCGVTVNVKDKSLNTLFQNIGKRLNLYGREYKGIPLYGAWDIEGHVGTDGKYYALDFGRVFPPEFPRNVASNAIFYNLLRPSFVKQYPVPLCSDALSSWLANDPNQKEINTTIVDATKYLHFTLVPKAAAYLEKLPQPGTDDDWWLHSIHNMGLNYRHLGYIRHHITKAHWRRTILTECVARALKNELRGKLRQTMEEKKIATVQPYLLAVFQYLQPILYYRQKCPTCFYHVEEKKVGSGQASTSGLDVFDQFNQKTSNNKHNLTGKEETALRIKFCSPKQGVPRQDRIWTNNDKVPNCWIAEEGVTWLLNRAPSLETREAAVQLLQSWQSLGLFSCPHISEISDGYYFFCFKFEMDSLAEDSVSRMETNSSSDSLRNSSHKTSHDPDPFDLAYPPDHRRNGDGRIDMEAFGMTDLDPFEVAYPPDKRGFPVKKTPSLDPFDLAYPPDLSADDEEGSPNSLSDSGASISITGTGSRRGSGAILPKSASNTKKKNSTKRHTLTRAAAAKWEDFQAAQLQHPLGMVHEASSKLNFPSDGDSLSVPGTNASVVTQTERPQCSLQVTNDKKRCSFKVTGYDSSLSFFANAPLPYGASSYFEVKCSSTIHFSVGLSETKNIPVKQVHSFSSNGITTIEGNVVQCEETRTRDTIGIFYSELTRMIFFTVNNLIIRKENLAESTKQLFPSLIVHPNSSQHTSFTFQYNFGQDPFVFPIHEYCSNALYCEVNATGDKEVTKEAKKAKKFWTQEVKTIVETRFLSCLTPGEIKPGYHFLDSSAIDFPKFIRRLQSLKIVKFSNRLLNLRKFQAFSLKQSDIIDLESRVQHMGIIERSQALTVLLTLSQKMVNTISPDFKEELELFTAAEQNFSGSLRLYSFIEPASRYIWAQLFFEIALRTNVSHVRAKRLKQAQFQIGEAVKSRSWASSDDVKLFQDVYFLRGLILIEKAHLQADKLTRLGKYGKAAREYLKVALERYPDSKRLKNEIEKMLSTAQGYLTQEGSLSALKDKAFWAKALFTAFSENQLTSKILFSYIHLLALFYAKTRKSSDMIRNSRRTSSVRSDRASKSNDEIQFDSATHLGDTIFIASKRNPRGLEKFILKALSGVVDTLVLVTYLEACITGAQAAELIPILNSALAKHCAIRVASPLTKETFDLLSSWAGTEFTTLSPNVKGLLTDLIFTVPIAKTSKRISSVTAGKTEAEMYVQEVFNSKSFIECGDIFAEVWSREGYIDADVPTGTCQAVFVRAYDYTVAGRRIWSRVSEEGTVLAFCTWHLQGFQGPPPPKFLKGMELSKAAVKKVKELWTKIEGLQKAWQTENSATIRWHLEHVCVRKIHRGQGFASAVLKPMLHTANHSQTICSTIAFTEASLAFFDKLGFLEPKPTDEFPKLLIRHPDKSHFLTRDPTQPKFKVMPSVLGVSMSGGSKGQLHQSKSKSDTLRGSLRGMPF